MSHPFSSGAGWVEACHTGEVRAGVQTPMVRGVSTLPSRGRMGRFRQSGVGKAEVEPYDPTYGQRGVAYCLKRELDGHGREWERYDYLSRKLIQTILRASASQVVVAALPPRTS